MMIQLMYELIEHQGTNSNGRKHLFQFLSIGKYSDCETRYMYI